MDSISFVKVFIKGNVRFFQLINTVVTFNKVWQVTWKKSTFMTKCEMLSTWWHHTRQVHVNLALFVFFQVPFKSKMSRPSNLIFWKIKNSNDVFRVRHNPSSSHHPNPFYKTLLCGFSLYVSAFIILFKKAVWLYHKLEVYMFFDFL